MVSVGVRHTGGKSLTALRFDACNIFIRGRERRAACAKIMKNWGLGLELVLALGSLVSAAYVG